MSFDWSVAPDTLREKAPTRTPLVSALLEGKTIFVAEEKASKKRLNSYYEVIRKAGKKLSIKKAEFEGVPGSVMYVNQEEE